MDKEFKFVGYLERSHSKIALFEKPSPILGESPQYYVGKDEASCAPIWKVINNTVFFRNTKFTFYEFLHKETVAIVKSLFPAQDPLLIDTVKLCEGADFSDIEKIADLNRIESFENLESSLSFLGYPGEATGLIVGSDSSETKRVFVQRVTSYMEGYSVEHFEVPWFVFAACQTDRLKEIYSK